MPDANTSEPKLAKLYDATFYEIKSPHRSSPREFTSNIYGNFSNPVRYSMLAVEGARG